jgi:ATP-dependent RNA helicase RhlE
MFRRPFHQIGRGNLVYRSNGREKFAMRQKTFDPTNFISDMPQTIVPDIKIEEVKTSFLDFKISDKLRENIIRKGYKVPTPIQEQAIPSILEGKDLIGVANTGTGKTAAFLIPLIERISNQRRTKVLIITPTRELAVQIEEEQFEFSKNLNIYAALCIGGSNINRQIRELRDNPNFVIGTPGRIMDLIRSKKLHPFDYDSVVLDETDRMVDIGFIKDIRYIISLLPQKRQSLFFSATVDGKVQDILKSFVKEPVVVSVKTRETAQNIVQNIIKVTDARAKIEKLHEVLIQKECEKVLIFGRTKHGVQKLSDELIKRGFKADVIHGNKKQNQRIRTLEKFKRSEIKILIATDVASRGLDIPNVSHVINYDLPESKESYIHRIGRTGRADKKGVALTFV